MKQRNKKHKLLSDIIGILAAFSVVPLFNNRLVHKNLMNINIDLGRLKNMHNFDEKLTVGVCQRTPKLTLWEMIYDPSGI